MIPKPHLEPDRRTLSAGRRRAPAAIFLLAALIGGCASLPPDEAPLSRRDAAAATIEPAADLPPGAWPDAQWWQRYHDEQLTALVDRALQDAPSMATAQARVRIAERSAEAARAQLGASIDADASLTREKLSHNGLIPPPYGGMTIYDAEAKLGLSYDFDFWGRNRAALAAALDEAHAARAEQAAAALVLASGVVQQYFAWQALQARIGIAERELELHERQIHLLRLRGERGLEASAAVDEAVAQREQRKQGIALLKTNQRLVHEQLVALLGATPGTLPALTPAALPDDGTGVPERLGLDLLARRPDIEADRLRIEAATRRTESARAQFYPDLNISAFLGLSSVALSRFLNADSLTAGVTPALHLPLFDAGRLRANLRVSRAQLDLAIAQYNQAIVDAASEVARQASLLAGLAEQRAALQAATRASDAVVANARTRDRQGLADARETIAAELPRLQELDGLLQLDGQRLDAQVALIKALGGGYLAPAGAAATSSD